MFRFGFALLAIVPFSFCQNLPALRWVQQIDNLGVDTFAGMGTDAQGNIYVAGNTTSPNFPVKAAVQSYLASAGLYRIDGTGSAYSRVGSKFVVSRLAADPLNPNVFYAVSPSSCVKSVDGGNTWTPLSIPVSAVERFAVDPSNDQNVYAAVFDLGFFKSADGGATWNLVNNGITLSEDSLAWGIWIDPNSHVLFGNYGASVVRSTDGGASWQTVASAYDFTLYFETPNPGVLYIFSGVNIVLKSTDDGQTFQAVTIPVTSIFADPRRAGRLLGNGQGGIFESDDDGVTWALALPISGGVAAADWANGVLYGYMSASPGVFQISSNLKTVTPVGPPNISATGLVVSNGHVYIPNSGLKNVFVTKFDPSGNVVYATYFGGSGGDSATAMAVDAVGNVYVTGGNGPGDFPTTTGTYAPTWSQGAYNFLFKLNPDGSLGYSTYFPAGNSSAAAIAVDGTGSVYLTGSTNGGLPTTPGAYQTVCGCTSISTGFAIPKPDLDIYEPDAFLTKFDPAGSTLVYSTYLGVENAAGRFVALGSDGSAYIASSGSLNENTIYHINVTGSSLLASEPSIYVGAMAVAADGGLYLAGSTFYGTPFQTTAGAFQANGPLPALPGQSISDVSAILKMDSQLQNVLAATYFGGPYAPGVSALVIDATGNIYIGGGGPPRGLPTRTLLFGAFGPVNGGSGFLSELSGDLSTLLFSTYLGDTENFGVSGVALGSGGSVVIGGVASGADPNGFNAFSNVYVNSLTVAAPPALRIDSILNAASVVDGPLSEGETIVVRGAGFGSDAQLMIGGAVVQALSMSAGQITAVVPSSLPNVVAIQVQSGGAASNLVVAPVAVASPGIFSANGSGLGRGYILNKDGTLNSPSNPASPGDKITVYATGVGPVSFTDGYAVTGFPANVFVDGFYCAGVAAVMEPVAGFPGSVYQITVYVPNPASMAAGNPNLQNFTFPPLVGVIMQIAGGSSQNGLSISIGQ